MRKTEQPCGMGGTSIVRFDNAIPPFAAAELDRLYGNPYASLLQMQIYESVGSDVNTFVAYRDGEVVQLLLYRLCRDRVRVLNEGLKLDSEEIARFCEYVFAEYPGAHVIVFHAIETEEHMERLDFPFQRHNCLEDIAMPLPDTIEAYRSGLGKNTRRNVKRYMDRLTKTFPSFRFEAHEGDAIEERHVSDIVACNRSRMAAKQKVSAIDDAETHRIFRMAKACGMVGLAFIDEFVCGGTISYRTGDNYFLYVLAHDPDYDGYWIGILTCYLTICECIKRGGKEFHFLWGRYEYKFTLGATPRNLDHLTVYRSRVRQLRHVRTAVNEVYRDYRRRAEVWLRYDVMEKHKKIGALIRHVVNSVRPAAG